MRTVRRRFTRPRHPHISSLDFPDVESGVDTLLTRFRALKDGDALYPWSHTRLQIANGKRRWIAK